jgi:hypothetical protein
MGEVMKRLLAAMNAHDLDAFVGAARLDPLRREGVPLGDRVHLQHGQSRH